MSPKKFSRTKIIIIVVVVALAAWLIYKIANPKPPAVNEVTATRGNITQNRKRHGKRGTGRKR